VYKLKSVPVFFCSSVLLLTQNGKFWVVPLLYSVSDTWLEFIILRTNETNGDSLSLLLLCIALEMLRVAKSKWDSIKTDLLYAQFVPIPTS
jgi:hypothetical protein